MSERDITRVGNSSGDITKPPVPSPSTGQQLLNSKSVPALHHVGNIGSSANKSRSIHNLAGGGGGIGGGMGTVTNGQDQGFYQNLSVYRAQNQSHPNLGDRPPMPLQGSLNSPGASNSVHHQQQLLQQQHQLQQQQQHPILNRPASAYFNSNNSSNNTNQGNLLLTTPNSMSYNMPNQQPNNVSNNGNPSNISQQQQQQQSNMNTMNSRLGGLKHQQQQQMVGGGPSANVNGFMRDVQAQQSLRMNQMMAPSMPNIAHSVAGGYHPSVGGISASQSMQNVNMIPGGPGSPAGGAGYNYPGSSANGSPMLSPQLYPHDQQHQQLAPNHHSSLLRGQAKLAEMNELIKRRQQQQQQPVAYNTAAGANKPPQQQHMMPPSTAPKPVRAQEDQPPLPPASTHPLFKPGTVGGPQPSPGNQAYSSSEPPKVGFYPSMAQGQKNMPPMGNSNNPWEREEKEKETELRREHLRAWRDQQILELQSLPQRTQQQEEQLRTLALERDFERRAMEDDQDYDNDLPYGAKEQGSVQEVVRLAQPSTAPLTAPMTKLKQVDIKQASDTLSLTSSEHSSTVQSVSTAIASFQQQQQQHTSSGGTSGPPLIQPKSILKHNTNSSTPSSPSKGAAKTASFAHDNNANHPAARSQLNLSEITANNTNANQMMSQMVHDMNHLNLASGAMMAAGEDRENSSEYGNPAGSEQLLLNGGITMDSSSGMGVGGVPPPPPPERNSSYVIMSQQQQKLRPSSSGPGSGKLSFGGGSNSPALDQQQNIMNNNATGSMMPSAAGGNGVGTLGGRYSNNNLLMTAPPGNNQQLNAVNPSIANSSSALMMGGNNSGSYKDNKRVSFHDEDAGNNNNPSTPVGYTQAGHLIGGAIGNESGAAGELGTIMERPDPDRFIDETMPAMLHTPTTPDGENWNMQIQATPGVIGAQEVYRDPRTRRLAEQQQKQKSEPVPEKLSFKEKMKMFALESGENNTPKDKLKISRAQRDIDAVH